MKPSYLTFTLYIGTWLHCIGHAPQERHSPTLSAPLCSHQLGVLIPSAATYSILWPKVLASSFMASKILELSPCLLYSGRVYALCIQGANIVTTLPSSPAYRIGCL